MSQLSHELSPEVLEALGKSAPKPPPHSRQVFVNRDLRLDRMHTIGFDMDYTLAKYKDYAFEALTYEQAIEFLIQNGYSDSLRKLVFDPNMVIRGLVVDGKLGNVVKLDRYYHAGRVRHGTKIMSKDERRATYGTRRFSMKSKTSHWIDTLFEVPEVCLYMQLVDLLDNKNGTFDPMKILQDVRAAMDNSHATPQLKGKILQDPGTYVEDDPLLAEVLHRFRSSGKQLFLLTNSSWKYTNGIMRHLLDERLDAYPSWLNYFDTVVVSAKKPGFFTSNSDPKILPAGQETTGGKTLVLEGGSLKYLKDQLGIEGETVLYIGDHIYGDILRSKKDSLWRTAMVIPELEREVEAWESQWDNLVRTRELENRRLQLDNEINFRRTVVRELERIEKSLNPIPEEFQSTLRGGIKILKGLRGDLKDNLAELRALQDSVNQVFNPVWGMLFREENEKSRFGQLIEKYACLYTSRVSNFGFYSPLQYFRSPLDSMPHEVW